MSFNVINENKILAKFFECADSPEPLLLAYGTQRMDIDEDSDQNLDLAPLDTSPGYIHMGVKRSLLHTFN